MKRKAEITTSILFILNGLICIIFSEFIQEILPYISGSIAILSGIILLTKAIYEKEYKTIETKRTAISIIMILIGIIIIFKNENSINLIGVVWGIYGLVKGINELNIAIYYIFSKEKFILELLHSIVEIVLAIILIFNPFEKIATHIILLGIEMIVIYTMKLFKVDTTEE